MALSNSFSAANFTKDDVEALVAPLDADPANMDKAYVFGNALYGQAPFPAALFTAAKAEMLRRYAEIHVPQAESDAAAAEQMQWSSRGAEAYVTEDGENADVVFARIKRSQLRAVYDKFSDIADSNAATMAHVAGEAMKVQRQQQAEWHQFLAQQVADAEVQIGEFRRQQADHARITGVVGQIGTLNQPVAAPKLAKFKQRAVNPSR